MLLKYFFLFCQGNFLNHFFLLILLLNAGEREPSAVPAVIAPKAPVDVATIAMIDKSALDKDVDHVFVASKVDLLKCKCYNAELELVLFSSGRQCVFECSFR